MDNDFKVARRASGLTTEQAAKGCGVAQITYTSIREKNPGSFRLDELRGLYASMPTTAKELLRNAIDDFVCS